MTKRELDREISEYEDGKLTRTNARDLAALYVVRENLFPDEPERAALSLMSFAGADAVPEYGDSEFYRAVAGKDPQKAWGVMSELMDILSVVHAKLYNQVLRELQTL